MLRTEIFDRPRAYNKAEALQLELISAGQLLYSKNLLPATSGNLSLRYPEKNSAIITVSGKCKGNLGMQDFLEVDLNGLPLNTHKTPSAETLLHTQLYKFSDKINAVFHVHSINSVVISKLIGAGKELRLTNYELLKAYSGVKTHNHTEIIPIFRNTQNIASLAVEVEQYLKVAPDTHAYLIEGHGIYSWGNDAAEAIRHLDATETLIQAELTLRALQQN
jgi:methylthioribulose-1-phosphate dehydratase